MSRGGLQSARVRRRELPLDSAYVGWEGRGTSADRHYGPAGTHPPTQLVTANRPRGGDMIRRIRSRTSRQLARTALVTLATVALLPTSPAGAVIGGQDDGSAHPYVGGLDASPVAPFS